MTSSSCSNLHSTTPHGPSSGQAVAVVLFVVGGIFALGGGLATASESKLDSIRGWFNQYPKIKSGRCKSQLAPT